MIVVQCTAWNYITISIAFYNSSRGSFALPTGYQNSSDMITFRAAKFRGKTFGLKMHNPPDVIDASLVSQRSRYRQDYY